VVASGSEPGSSPDGESAGLRAVYEPVART
jgi:hypothetical protein